MSDLERRAEELITLLIVDGSWKIRNESAQVIEQLLSENRQGEHAHIYTNYQGYVDELKSTIASLRQDLDRISAEREAYRETVGLALDEAKECFDDEHVYNIGADFYFELRRILAENDR